MATCWQTPVRPSQLPKLSMLGRPLVCPRGVIHGGLSDLLQFRLVFDVQQPRGLLPEAERLLIVGLVFLHPPHGPVVPLAGLFLVPQLPLATVGPSCGWIRSSGPR